MIRADAGLLPEYRGRGVTFGFGMFRALNDKRRAAEVLGWKPWTTLEEGLATTLRWAASAP